MSHQVAGKNDEDHNERNRKECDLSGKEIKEKANEEELTHDGDREGQQLHVLVRSDDDDSKEVVTDQSYFAKITMAMNSELSPVAPLSPATSLLSEIMVSLESMKSERSSKSLTTNKRGILSRTGRRPSIVRFPTRRRVRFVPESLILSAALEGDLALLCQCVLQVHASLSMHGTGTGPCIVCTYQGQWH